MNLVSEMIVNQQPPWYRQFWPWFIMVPPATAVIAGLFTLYVAGTVPPMVVDDYGRIAMATQQRVERERRAEELGLSAHIEFAIDGNSTEQPVVVTLTQADSSRRWPDHLYLNLVHPTLAERDRKIVLEGTGGRYVSQAKRPSERVYIVLTDNEGNWRMAGEISGGAAHHKLGGGSE